MSHLLNNKCYNLQQKQVILKLYNNKLQECAILGVYFKINAKNFKKLKQNSNKNSIKKINKMLKKQTN